MKFYQHTKQNKRRRGEQRAGLILIEIPKKLKKYQIY